MAPVPGSIPVTGELAPTDLTDTYAIADTIYLRGGYRSVASTAVRNAITVDRSALGMLVAVGTTVYQLTTYPPTGVNADWTLFTTGGGGGGLGIGVAAMLPQLTIFGG